jgi:hypothetical protein
MFQTKFVQKIKTHILCSVTFNIRARSRNHCCSGHAISITYSKCVSVALGIQHAIHMRHFVTCVLLTLSHKRHIFGQKSY